MRTLLRCSGVATILVFGASLIGPRAVRAGAEEPSARQGAAVEEEEEPVSLSRLIVRGFGNIDWLSRSRDDPSTFVVGQLDLFLTSELADDVSLLAEIVLEAVDDPEEQIADVERFQIQYAPSDAFRVAAGRMHTVLGYWNQTYHHGAWLYTTVSRPEVYRWEDEDGGILPVHEVGLRVFGSAATSALRVEYNASLGNGRGVTPREVVTVQDPNGAKALNLWVGVQARAWPGLEVGGVAHFDTIPARPGDPARANELQERILGGFVALRRSEVEVLAEAFEIRHDDDATGGSYRTTGLYAQAAVAFGRFKPYYRFDLIDRDEVDPFWGEAIRDLHKHTLGLRVDSWSRVVLKLEVSHNDPRSDDTFTSAAAQVAFTF